MADRAEPSTTRFEDDGAVSSDDDAGGNDGDGDATESKLKNKKSDEVGYDTDEDEDDGSGDELPNSAEDKEEQESSATTSEQNKPDEEEEMINAEALNVSDTKLEENTEKMLVQKQSEMISDYTYDKQEHRWCQVVFHMPMKYKDIDFTQVLREIAEKCVVWQVNNQLSYTLTEK